MMIWAPSNIVDTKKLWAFCTDNLGKPSFWHLRFHGISDRTAGFSKNDYFSFRKRTQCEKALKISSWEEKQIEEWIEESLWKKHITLYLDIYIYTVYINTHILHTFGKASRIFPNLPPISSQRPPLAICRSWGSSLVFVELCPWGHLLGHVVQPGHTYLGEPRGFRPFLVQKSNRSGIIMQILLLEIFGGGAKKRSTDCFMTCSIHFVHKQTYCSLFRCPIMCTSGDKCDNLWSCTYTKQLIIQYKCHICIYVCIQWI